MEHQSFEETKNFIDDMITYVKQIVDKFGVRYEGSEKRDYIFRNNTNKDALENGGAYFGFIAPYEEESGPYHDFSLVIFPSNRKGEPWLVSLGVGTLGFKNDYEQANLPGIRRSFQKIVDPNQGFIKTSFLDIESRLPVNFTGKIPHLSKILKPTGSY